MEHAVPFLLLGLLTGLIGYPEPARRGSSAASVSPNWPPRTAQDLVLLLQGTDPSCLESGQTTSGALTRQLLGFVPQLLTSGSPTNWLYGALSTFLNASSTQGDLKHLLLWGMSHNLSWGFATLTLVPPPSAQSQFPDLSMKCDLPTFLKICSDHLFPALKNICDSMDHSFSLSLQSMCLVLTASPQSSQMNTQFCTIFFSSLSDLVTRQCNTRMVRASRSATINCAYATWYNSSTVSSSDVSTCSESDRDQFISSVCGDQKLLNQLASQSANNWLVGYCIYNTNPAHICHYATWGGNIVTAFSVAYCWLYDQDQFISFLCTNPNVLDQLKENVDNQWLEPTCPTLSPTTIASTSLLQELCNYDQWPLQTVDPTTVVLCEETDGDGFTQNVCKSFEILQKLLIDDSNLWVAVLCQQVMPLGNECNYTLWQKTDSGSQLLVDPSIVAYCSQVDQSQFVSYVCNNPSLLLNLSKETNTSWVLPFCVNNVCNYTAWLSSSPTSSTVDLCWLIDQERLKSYLCSHQNVFQSIGLNGTSAISCAGNSTNQTVCSYTLWNLTVLNPSILADNGIQVLVDPSIVAYCSQVDQSQFISYVCNNPSLLLNLSKETNTSWVLPFCVKNVCNYTAWLSSSPTSSTVDLCWLIDQDQLNSYLCSHQHVLKSNGLNGTSDIPISCAGNSTNQTVCSYTLWNMTVLNPSILAGSGIQLLVDPSIVAYCSQVDQSQFISYVCNNPSLLLNLSKETNTSWVLPFCVNNVCNYTAWLSSFPTSSTVDLCWVTDQERLKSYLCSHQNVFQSIGLNGTSAISCAGNSTNQTVCSYTLWNLTVLNPSILAGSGIQLLVDPSIVAYCSQVDQNQFVSYVCNNLSLLLNLSKETNTSWVLPFCVKNICNYTAWLSSSPTSSTVDLCWLIDQDQLNSYLCSHQNVFQSIGLNGTSAISCAGNSTNQTVCSYTLWNLTALNPSILGFCAVKDTSRFHTYICGNSFRVALLNNNPETSWVSIYCNTQILGNFYNCTDSLLNFHLQSCPSCNRTELEKIFHLVCNNQNLVQVLSLFWNSSSLMGKFIVWNLCYYSSWEDAPSYLVSYCWKFANSTISDFLCNDFQLYSELLQETNIQETPICDPNKTCQYSTWDLRTLQISLVEYCAHWDGPAFTQYICRNSTIMKLLRDNTNQTWDTLLCFDSISPSNTPDICNYGKWLNDTERWRGLIDFSTVYLCSKNDTVSFMMNVCNDSRMLGAISDGPALTWTLNLCYKLSTSNVLTQILIWDVCDYSQTKTFTPLMVEFCWLYDQDNFFSHLCSNITFYTIIKTQPQNLWFQPNCTSIVPTSDNGLLNYSIVQCHNQYSNPSNMEISFIKFCVEYDQAMFLNTFCNTTTFQQGNSSCSWGNELCPYNSWHSTYVHPVIVKACWATDQVNFTIGVCSDPLLLSQLLLSSANSWLRSVCGTQGQYQLESLVVALCGYKEWGNVSSVPGSIVAFCNAYSHETFMHSICDSQQEAICNDTIDQWWDNGCNYANWETGPIDLDETLICWVLEKENFTSHVCTQSILLSKLSNDPRTSWVTQVCSTTSALNETDVCLSDKYKTQLQWNCSVDLSIVCAGNDLTAASFLPISICYLQNSGVNLSTANITSLYTQAVDAIVILLYLLEDMQIISMSNTSGIQAQVLNTTLHFISQETSPKEKKTELLQKFGNILLLLTIENATSYSWTIIETLFNLTLSDLQGCISSLQPKSAKQFLSLLSQNQTSLQVSDDYFSMIVFTLLSVQVPSEPLLFCDIVPFLHYLEPDELIRLLPPLQDNKEVLMNLSLYVRSLSYEQQFALGFWLRRSTLFENSTKMDDVFIRQIANLLPLFSLDVFQKLSAQQVVNILPGLPDNLTPPYQRVVASKVLQAPNITVQDVELMGRIVCQANGQDLRPYGQNTNVSLVLQRNLLQCVRRGELFPDSMMLDYLFGDVRSQDLGELSLGSVPNLSLAISSLDYDLLQSLRPVQLLPVLPDVASWTMTSSQAWVLVQKILSTVNVSDEVLSRMGSLVLGISPSLLQQLSDSQLGKLLPSLASNAHRLSSAQTLAVFKTMWATWNVSQKLNELGPLLPSLPLVMLRTRIKELLSNLTNLNQMGGVKWNQQQALLLIRKVTQTMGISGVRSSANSVTGSNCDSLRGLLQNNTLQAMEQFHQIIDSLPRPVIRCALDDIITLPPTVTLLKRLSSQMISEIQPSAISLLPAKSCRYVIQILKSEAQSVAALPQQRRFGLLDALTCCLNSTGTTSPQAQFIVFGALTPLLKGSAYVTLSQGMMLQNVERVTNDCYPQETQLPLSQLLQGTQGFGPTTRWTSQILKRLDRLVPLLPLASLQSLNSTALSSLWLYQMLSDERLWRGSALGTACRKTITLDQQEKDMQKLRTLLQRWSLARSMLRSSAVLAPDCGILRGSIVSAWGVQGLLKMTPDNFTDCLEVIGQDPDIPNSELAPLLARVLKMAGPLSALPDHVLMRLGRLATKLNVQQLKVVSLKDLQVMEAFGKQQEWTTSQLNTIVNGFMQSHNVTAKDLDALHLVTLGYAICGLSEKDMEQIEPLEFCSAVLYVGQLALRCTEQQFEVLARLCTGSDMFGPVSGWTEDVFLEIGSVAAGLQDMEFSALILEQIQGLTPLAISLISPKKFSVSFSSQQLQLFSWSQAKEVTSQQMKLLDTEQMKALTLALTEDSGNQIYRAGKSSAGRCSYCTLLHLTALLPVLQYMCCTL